MCHQAEVGDGAALNTYARLIRAADRPVIGCVVGFKSFKNKCFQPEFSGCQEIAARQRQIEDANDALQSAAQHEFTFVYLCMRQLSEPSRRK